MISLLGFLYENWGLILGIVGGPIGFVLLGLGRRVPAWLVIGGACLSLVGWAALTVIDRIDTLKDRAEKAEAMLQVVTDERDHCCASLDLTATEVRLANGIAMEAADACRATLKYIERGQRVGKQVRSSTDPYVAYRNSLCERPEALNHPACAR